MNSPRLLTSEERRRIQLAVLDDFAERCARLDLTWHLGFGSLLGAARHRGYIPWDDDIDVLMPRADFNRYLQSEDGIMAVAGPGRTPGWPFGWAKVWDPRTRVTEETDLRFVAGVGIDVFPVDTVASRRMARNVQMAAARTGHVLEAAMSVRVRPEHGLKGVILRLLKPLLAIVGQRFLAAYRTRVATSAPRGGYAGVLVGTRPFAVPAACFEPDATLQFEGRCSPVAKGWSTVLTAMYGDFMQLPPEDARTTHHAQTATWEGPA